MSAGCPMISCAEHGSLQSDLICPKCYASLEARLRTRERHREALERIAAWADSSDTTPCEVIASRALNP